MKNFMFIAVLVVASATGNLLAQPHETIHREKMKAFSSWVGDWKGEGAMQMGPGEPKKSTVVEKLEYRLGGTVLLIEGKGTAPNPSTGNEEIVHHALAVLSYDAEANEYKFKSYLYDGRSTDAWFKIIADNKFQWGFSMPRGQMRYDIALEDDGRTWRETGEFSADGKAWHPVFKMNLTKME